MTRLPLILLFVVMTFLCWGSYGPVLHLGQMAMEHSRWRPFICVGIAYFLIAVVGPLSIMRLVDETGRWTMSGIVWSLAAGAIGALGALGIILAFQFGGKPVYVMPVVFGCAPVVNTFVTMSMAGTHRQVSLPFYGAVIAVALGAAGVFVFKPTLAPPTAAVDSSSVDTANIEAAAEELVEKKLEGTHGVFDWFKALLAIAGTAVCWGAYGPILHKGQAKMAGSRLRPFICVGMAYFAIAVVVPLLVLGSWGDAGHWNFLGTFWSLIAGAVGAVGALGIILAFNFGGRPVFVMPLVFGGAPIVNTMISMTQSFLRSGSVGSISPLFLGSLVLVITGAVCVLLFAPSAKPKADPASKDEPSRDRAAHPSENGAAGQSTAKAPSADGDDAGGRTDDVMPADNVPTDGSSR